MFLEQTRFEQVSDELQIRSWEDADHSADVLAVCSPIRDYSPLSGFPNLRRLWIYQVNPEQLIQIGRLPQLEKLHINWLKPTNDLTPLANLRNLQFLVIMGNMKEVSLEPLRQLTQLRVLSLAALVSTAINGGRVYCESFIPLAELHNLEYLELSAIKPRDQSLEPLTHLKSLEILEFFNDFSLRDYAHLAVALPNTKGKFRTPYYSTTSEYNKCKKCGSGDIIVLFGKKRGAFICPHCDQDKLDKHLADFEHYKQEFM